MGGKRRPKANRKLGPHKEVQVRKDRGGWTISLPDWKLTGSYHIHIRHRRWEELTALRECVDELEEKGDA